MKLSLFAFTFLYVAKAFTQQADTILLNPISATVVTFNNGNSEGYLNRSVDSTLIISPFKSTGKNLNEITTFYYFKSNDIQKILIKKKNSWIKGALIGFGAGAILGAVIAKRPEPPTSTDPLGAFIQGAVNGVEYFGNTFILSFGCGLGGGLVGGLIGGSATIKIPINGDKNKLREFLKKYSLN